MIDTLDQIIEDAKSFCVGSETIDVVENKLRDGYLLETPEDLHKYVESYLAKINGKCVVLLSGGEDSSYLLHQAVAVLGKGQVSAIMAKTTGSSRDHKRAFKLCRYLDVQLTTLTPDRTEITEMAEKYRRKFGELSADPAQPIHNVLIEYITDRSPEAVILDGQFADTVLHSNPHNSLLLLLEKYPDQVKFGRTILSKINWVINNRRLKTVQRLLETTDKTGFIMRAARVVESDLARHKIERLIDSYGAQTVLSAMYYWGLTAVRERQKYKLIDANYLLPFDNEALFWYGSKNQQDLISILVRKKVIHNFLMCYYPRLFLIQNTRPFEAI